MTSFNGFHLFFLIAAFTAGACRLSGTVPEAPRSNANASKQTSVPSPSVATLPRRASGSNDEITDDDTDVYDDEEPRTSDDEGGTTEDRKAADPKTFGRYDCTRDCSGHQAGYDWAERKGITDPDDCGGRSRSFIEGCRAYARENGW